MGSPILFGVAASMAFCPVPVLKSPGRAGPNVTPCRLRRRAKFVTLRDNSKFRILVEQQRLLALHCMSESTESGQLEAR
jgi:hypothetical protein